MEQDDQGHSPAMGKKGGHRLGDLLLGFEGLAIMRNFWMNPDLVHERVKEVEEIIARRDSDDALSYRDYVAETDLVSGYDRWAATYDEVENPITLADDLSSVPCSTNSMG